MFEQEKEVLLSTLGECIGAIEHIGSTSVIGLVAKPIIDIMIGLRDFSAANDLVLKLEKLGYEYITKYESILPYRRHLIKRHNGTNTHHIHMVEINSEFWERHLLFRNFLRQNPDAAREYASLKKRLAKLEWGNADEYSDAKTPFIRGIENEARKRSSIF
jgi:GrpB-like predicted nucleotidyltransferase (UPF0157 family)